MDSIFIFLYSLLCFALIGSVMVQRGAGADMGGGFGGGASQTVFGSQGSASFLTRATAVLAALFFISCLVFSFFQQEGGVQVDSVMSQLPVVEGSAPPVQEDIPALDEESFSSADDVPAVPVE